MEEKLIAYLVERYNPIGIILHGSRAGGYATEHSDWDFFVFTKETIFNKRRHEHEVVDEQFLDIMLWEFPISKVDMKGYFAKYCGIAKLVYTSDSAVNQMFTETQDVNKNGLEFTDEEIKLELEDIRKGLERLSDWINDNSGVFFLRSASLYDQLYNAWWNIKNKKYSISTRIGIARINLEDSQFHILLQIVAGNASNKEKYEALLKMKDSIFGGDGGIRSQIIFC